MASLAKKLDDLTYQRRTIFWANYMRVRALMKNGFRSRTILFYPNKPRMWSILYPICNILGYTMTNDPSAKFDVAIAFETETQRTPNATLEELAKKYYIWNVRCDDIGKDRVERVFAETFGYSFTVDPRTYKGPYIKKTKENATHEITIMTSPSEPEPGFVYEKLINNQTDADWATDIRTFIFGDNIPFTLYRKHSASDRFRDDALRATRVDTDIAFTKQEQADIIHFCKNFGLDYGELDILRDKNDGKIYIVDVNNTPSGPHPGVHMNKDEYYNRFLTELAAAFEKMVLEYISKNPNQVPSV